jgi:hypothetical protein
VPTLPDLTDLREFVGQDIAKSFWNGSGKVTVLSEAIIDALQKDPLVTVGALRARLAAEGKPLIVQTGLDFNIDAEDTLSLGSRHGKGGGHAVAFSAHVDVDARVMLILSADTFGSLKDQHPDDLGTLLHDHTVLTGQDALVVIAAGGEAGAEFASTVLNRPGVNVGISFKAGAGVNWVVCRPAHDGDKVLEAIRQAFAGARLPQSDPDEIVESGKTVFLGPNEIVSTSFNGFMALGGEATFGYETSGSANYELGAMKLATRLTLKARAKVNVGYSLAGSFRTSVLPGALPGWVRVVVEKTRKSTFDFGVGVTVEATLATKGLPTEGGGLALLESILGFHTPQVAQQILELSSLSPEEIAKKADGAIKGFVEKWAGEGFDQLMKGDLKKVFDKVSDVARQITSADDRVIALYEQYVVNKLDPALTEIESILAKASTEDQRKALLDKISDEKVRTLVELLVDRAFASVVVSFDSVVTELAGQVKNLREAINNDVEGLIRKFIEARTESLGLMPLIGVLKTIDTPQDLRNTSIKAVVGLAERLTGDTVDKILASPKAAEVVGELNAIAKGIDDTLAKFNDIVNKALNAQGRFELSYAYQRVREGQKLVDVQIHVDQPNAQARARAHELYRNATRGKFADVLSDSNAGLVRVSSAAFTDVLKKVGKLKVNVFGWDYKEVKTLLSSLKGNVKESPTGLITVYAIKASAQTLTESRKRTVALGYTFQVTGQVKGAFEDAKELRKRTVDVFETLSQVQSELDYRITDKLTSLDELRSYLVVGEQLRVLDPGQKARLIGSIQELRQPANGAPAAIMEKDFFKSVGITYTVGFSGEALARALSTDLTGRKIDWWGDKEGESRPRISIFAPNHETAVRSIYADCLVASFVLGRQSNLSDYAPASLFKRGWMLDLDKNQGAVWPSSVPRVAEQRDGQTVFVSISTQAQQWARFHYLIANEFASFLKKFQVSLDRHQQQSLGELQAFLTKLVAKLQDAGQGEQASLPFLLLDELVRRTSPPAGPNDEEPRRALLEVTLFDDKNQPTNRIPIIG